MMMIRGVIATIAVILFMSGCAKEPDEYNKPADYWYEKMITAVSSGNLENADSYFSSLQSEHIGSPLLVDATLIMAQAHMAYEEYLLSEHFLDEYNRRYATREGREYAEFLKIKAKFMALPNPGRDQGLINETLKSVGAFKTAYPYSTYIPLVNTMETQLQLAKGTLNIHIAELYTRLGKPKGATYYNNIAPVTWIAAEDVVPATIPWYREMFEGDGTSSWYAFMIPNTRNVVSMEDNESVVLDSPKPIAVDVSTDQNKTIQSVSPESSWYDFILPWSSAAEPVKKENVVPPKSEQKGSWYDSLLPSF